MGVEWFNKEVGSDIGHSQDDSTMLLLDVGKPDYVNVPDGTGFGGRQRCVDLVVAPCPFKGHNHNCIHYILEGPVHVAECSEKGFLWYKAKKIVENRDGS